jgi:Zn-dependent peptidase ImmA (M78 family)/DNA-binding XRE family transcriptional regulator
MFKPSRLVIARKRRAMTKVSLAEESGVSLRSLSAYENGHTTPDDAALAQLATTLRFPVDFFFAHELEEPPQSIVSFRALSSMTAGKRDSAIAAAVLAIELSKWLEDRFSLPAPNVPDLRGTQPELAAEEVRAAWGAGTRPIRNMVHLLEANGVRVYSLAEVGEAVDAFSFNKDGTPFVFLSTAKSAERSRFDAAHELAHLVLHRHGVPNRDAEREADRFGSAFLMPAPSVFSVVPRNPSLGTLLELKASWSVSVAALAHRIYSLGMITEWHYRTLCIEIAKRGYRKTEPNPIPRETSQLLEKVFAAIREDGLTKADVARDLHVHLSDIQALVFGLVMVPLTGGGGRSGPPASPKPPLRAV